ncbi:MAG TPA: hypothetical protein VMM60_10410 [Ilumatobacter sp.]|nr:hypothetical protein [Ilumatobacter sp.]
MPQLPSSARTRAQPAQAPDFWARRMLASAAVITVIAVSVVVVWRLLGGDDQTTAAGADGSWNEIALVNRTRGDVTTLNTNGERIAEFTGFTRVLDVHAEGDRIALVGPSEIFIGSLSTQSPVPTTQGSAGDSTSTTTSGTRLSGSLPSGFTSVPYVRGTDVTRLPIAGRLVLAIGDPLRGGNALIVDGESGLVIDVGALAGQANPVLFIDTIQFDPNGNWFALADAANFQTIVVHAIDEPTIEYFPDVPVAVSDELVVTSQVVGQRADVAFFNHGGTLLGSVSMAIPAGGVLTDDGLVVVSVDGDVSRVGGNLTKVAGLGTIDLPSGGVVQRVDPTARGTRLVVAGDTFQTVIDLTGAELVRATFDPTDSIAEPQPGWSCLPLGPTDSLETVVSLDDGTELANGLRLEVTDIAADGCTVMGTVGRDTTVISSTGTSRFGSTRSGSLSPDGATVLLVTSTAQIQLITIDGDQLSAPIDLTELSQPNTLDVAFLNR